MDNFCKINLNCEHSSIVRKGQSKKWSFDEKEQCSDFDYSLFFACEDAAYDAVKHEGAGEKLYLFADDSLNSEEAENCRFCLDMSCLKPLNYPKRVVKKIVWKPLMYGVIDFSVVSEYSEKWKAGIFAKAKNLKIENGGYLRMRIDRFSSKDGQNPNFTRDACAETEFINIKEGTYGYTCFEKEMPVYEKETSAVIITVEGEKYSGNIYFERPYFISESGYNVLPDFDVSLPSLEQFSWLGQNMSKREWPYIQLSLNGNVFYKDEVFLHMHRFTPIEIDIPYNLVRNGTNEIELTYLSDYHDTVPLEIGEAYVLREKHSNFKVISVPDIVEKGKLVKICVETTEDNTELEFESNDFNLISEKTISKNGLHILSMEPIREKNKMCFRIGDKDKTESYIIERFTEKTDDNIICGSGDLIYTDVSDLSAVKKYLKWYLSEKIGNLLTIRQVYHWGGQRFVNPSVWKLLTNILNEAEISYVLLSDGRDLSSLAENPGEEMLSGKYFLGKQLHERDGQLMYWDEENAMPMEIKSAYEEFYDLVLRMSEERPENIEGTYRKFNISYKNGKYAYAKNTDCRADMKEACDAVSEQIKNLCTDNYIRHTGPSVMFRNFLEQGFEFVGAETMYGATEALLSFLRGASKAYGKNKFGVHQALQWGSFPHNDEGHLRRYIVSLLVSYMHGVTDINTEEGLWFQEGCYSYHNRLSETCLKHKEAEQRFYRYIKTHSRTGKFYTKTAFIHGKADGWNGFISTKIWGMPFMNTGSDGKSWELLKIFYPLNRVEADGMGVAAHYMKDADKPVGYFSGTPYGSVDVTPIEKGGFNDYSLLIFAGYNLADNKDMDRIYDSALSGATVVCAWPHLSDTTLRSDIESRKFHIADNKLTNVLSEGKPIFEKKKVNGEYIEMCVNISHNAEISEYTDDGTPMIYSVPVGKGKIVILNAMCYPAENCVHCEYARTIEKLHCDNLYKEDCRIICGEDIGYTQYIQEDGSMHFYLTPVDWYNRCEKPHTAYILLGGEKYPVSLKFGEITKIVYNRGIAAWTEDNSAEVLNIDEKLVRLCGEGNVAVHIINNGSKEYTADFSENYIQTIMLQKYK